MGSSNSSNTNNNRQSPLSPLYPSPHTADPSSYTAMATPAHCLYCFDVLASTLTGRTPLSLDKIEELYNKQQPEHADLPSATNGAPAPNTPKSYAAVSSSSYPTTPLFVTWKKRTHSPGHLALRGCIGTFDPKPLETGLRDYALTAWVPLLLSASCRPRRDGMLGVANPLCRPA